LATRSALAPHFIFIVRPRLNSAAHHAWPRIAIEPLAHLPQQSLSQFGSRLMQLSGVEIGKWQKYAS
jgi:hypothetical protein